MSVKTGRKVEAGKRRDLKKRNPSRTNFKVGDRKPAAVQLSRVKPKEFCSRMVVFVFTRYIRISTPSRSRLKDRQTLLVARHELSANHASKLTSAIAEEKASRREKERERENRELTPVTSI